MDITKKDIPVPNNVMHRADWVTLRDYVDARFAALLAEIAKGDEVMSARLHSMNEFRQTLRTFHHAGGIQYRPQAT
jgi:hypothetical protein